MKGKLAFVLGAAVGYVLGTRAGRERYEQIKRGATAVWQTEPVQRGARAVRSAVDDQIADLKEFAQRKGAEAMSTFARQAGATRPGTGTTPAENASAPAPATPTQSATEPGAEQASSSASQKETGA